MKTAARPKEPLLLTESAIRFTQPLRVDRDKGVVYGVKILGWESDNNRAYTPEAGHKAVAARLYEDRKTYADHPDPADAAKKKPRSVYDLTGKTFNIRAEADGVYGDWQLNKA